MHPPQPDHQLLYRPEGAAEVLDVGRSTVFELMADGQLESVRIGRSRRIPRQALHDYVERLRASDAAPATSVPTGPGRPLPREAVDKHPTLDVRDTQRRASITADGSQ